VEGGASVRSHLESVYRQTGKKPQQLQEEVKLPEWARFIWGVFVSLSSSRDWRDGHPRAIKPTEVVAYCDLMGMRLDPVEYELLKDLDREFIENGR